MDIQIVTKELVDITADTLILGCIENDAPLSEYAAQLNLLLNGEIGDLVLSQDITGKHGEITVIYPRNKIKVQRVLLVGLGKKENLTSEMVRRSSAVAMLRARDMRSNTVVVEILGLESTDTDLERCAQDTLEGALLALYQYQAPKKKKVENQITSIGILCHNSQDAEKIQNGVERAKAIALGISLARDLVNSPPNVATPSYMAETARKIADTHEGLNIFVGDRAWAEEKQMGAFLAVSQGAGEEPSFIVLEFFNGDKNHPPIIFVGKGITFDSGGISIKPSEGMESMKSDMAGAAAILGVMKAVATLNLKMNVIGIAPCTENMPGSTAFRPADVITASNGKTIEIISTDAEGRLILADALVYADGFHPSAVIDLATLTGACVVALGQGTAAGLFSNDDRLTKALVESGLVTHERVWPMPLYDDYKKKIESEVADLKNSGGRMGGVGTSAIFLKEFTNYPWVHLDIAGMALSEKGSPYSPSGATGYGVRLLLEFLRTWSSAG